MKKLFLILFVITIFFPSCQKEYPEGPMISFRSVYKRINGEWKVVEFTSNGADSLKNFKDSCSSGVHVENVDNGMSTSDKRYHMFFYFGKTNEFSTLLKFYNNEKNIYVDFGENGHTVLGPIGKGRSNWQILKLTMKEFKISTTYNGLNYIIKFEH